jgi:hypothetical protein
MYRVRELRTTLELHRDAKPETIQKRNAEPFSEFAAGVQQALARDRRYSLRTVASISPCGSSVGKNT